MVKLNYSNGKFLERMFDFTRIEFVPDFLASSVWQMRQEAEINIPLMTSSYIPTHKKGKTLSYENIRKYAPTCLEFYKSPEVINFISDVVGQQVYCTPETDQSSLSILCYNLAGDHINWHYYHNFYKGRHFTVLISLANEKIGKMEVSSCEFSYVKDGLSYVLPTHPNTLLIFEGAKILHKASPLKDNELRILLSMTYCTDPRISLLKEIARRIKDISFHGFQALWK